MVIHINHICNNRISKIYRISQMYFIFLCSTSKSNNSKTFNSIKNIAANPKCNEK